RANAIFEAMPGTLQLASSAQIDLARAADIVTNIMTGYNKKGSELAHVNDVLVRAFTSANTDLVQLAEAMKYAGPVASAAG
ncbi:MAG: phage tail tape measure protein, partial [Bifidobacteriales bacterium]|nr:phage tail tape measure protein [Bifidobacteriales bacterium]